VGEAFRALRARRDPDAALALLDRHDRLFPRGALALEAGLARVEALLGAGRRAAALDVLDGLADGRDEAARQRSLLRGELRADAGRCTEALADFKAAESAGGSAKGDRRARALWGQATCRARLGDAAGARRDFHHYLAAFPAGPHAADAQRWLEAHAAEAESPAR